MLVGGLGRATTTPSALSTGVAALVKVPHSLENQNWWGIQSDVVYLSLDIVVGSASVSESASPDLYSFRRWIVSCLQFTMNMHLNVSSRLHDTAFL